mgnify:FL=1
MAKGKLTLTILPLTSELHISDVQIDNGIVLFKLHVEKAPFVGYANTVAYRDANSKRVISSFLQFGNDILVTLTTAPNVNIFKNSPVNIPIGIYNCKIELSVIILNPSDPVEVQSGISFGKTTDYYNSIVDVSCYYSEGNIPV